MNPYVEYVLPKLRCVIQLFNEMTPEQKESMMKDNHEIFYNFEDVVNLMNIMDGNAARDRAELADVQRRLRLIEE